MTTQPEAPQPQTVFDYSTLPIAAAAEAMSNERSIFNEIALQQQSFFRTGELLVRQKEILGHGHWGNWLKAFFPKSERTAQHYMNVFLNIGSKYEIISDLARTDIFALAGPSVDAETRNEIIAKVEAGEDVDVKAELERMKKQNQKLEEENKLLNRHNLKELEDSIRFAAEQKANELAQAKIAEIEAGLDEKFQEAVEREVSANAKKIEDQQFTINALRSKVIALESPAEKEKLNREIADHEQRLQQMKIKISEEKINQDLDAIARTAIEYFAQLKAPLAETVIEKKTIPDFKVSSLTGNSLIEAAHELTTLAEIFRNLAFKNQESAIENLDEYDEQDLKYTCKECSKVLKNWEIDELKDVCEVCYEKAMA